jgi:hypothetical protein
MRAGDAVRAATLLFVRRILIIISFSRHFYAPGKGRSTILSASVNTLRGHSESTDVPRLRRGEMASSARSRGFPLSVKYRLFQGILALFGERQTRTWRGGYGRAGLSV